MKRLDHDKLPCKFANHYWEYLGEKWMGQCEMFECTYDGENKTADPCNEDKTCPAYQPIETIICPKHDEECIDICSSCEKESELMQEQAEQKYLEINDGQ